MVTEPCWSTHKWLMSVLLFGTSYSDPFLSKQIAPSIFKKRSHICLSLFLENSAYLSQGQWFWRPLLRTMILGLENMDCGLFSGFLFIQFNFICPITWGRLNENFEMSGLICRLIAFAACTLLPHLPFPIRELGTESPVLHLCIALSDKHHP